MYISFKIHSKNSDIVSTSIRIASCSEERGYMKNVYPIIKPKLNHLLQKIKRCYGVDLKNRVRISFFAQGSNLNGYRLHGLNGYHNYSTRKRQHTIFLNVWQSNKTLLDETLPHELAHAVCAILEPNLKSHAKHNEGWKSVFNTLRY